MVVTVKQIPTEVQPMPMLQAAYHPVQHQVAVMHQARVVDTQAMMPIVKVSPPTNKKLGEGSRLLVDFGPLYCADRLHNRPFSGPPIDSTRV